MRKIAAVIIKVLVFIFGRHSMPGLFTWIRDGFKQRRFTEFFSRVFRGLGLFIKRFRIPAVILGIVFVLGTAALITWRIWLSKQPQLIELSIQVQAPAPTDYETNTIYPLILSFNGSAAPLESAGKPVLAGIEIEPGINGEWRWEGDS